MKEIEFLYPLNGLFIIIAIGIVILYLLGKKKKSEILKVFKLSYNKRYFKILMASLTIGLLLIVVALMAPVKENGVTEVKGAGLDIYVLLDTSKSMLTEDIVPSRIERSKLIIEELLNSLEGDRIGFIPFSSAAYIQMPLTDDYQLGKMFIDVIDTDMISGGGTDLAKAIKLAVKSFEAISDRKESDKVIIILSDGEEHSSETLKLVKEIESPKLKIFSIGIGTKEGGLIPEYNQTGTQQIGYKKDSQGQVVVSKLNEIMLQEITALTGGEYYRTTNTSEEIDLLVNDIRKLKRGTSRTHEIKNYIHLYQYFLGLGMILLLVSLVFTRRLVHE